MGYQDGDQDGGDPRAAAGQHQQDGAARRGIQGQGGGCERPVPPRAAAGERVQHPDREAGLHRAEAGAHVKGCRHWESKTMNNEVEIEEIDKNLREAKIIAADNEMKYDNLARSLAMMEDELKRSNER